MTLQVLQAGDPRLEEAWRREVVDPVVEERVRDIIQRVQLQGDEALYHFTRELDGVDLEPVGLRVSPEEVAAAYGQVGEDFLAALREAAGNILAFHQKQLRTGWLEPDARGNVVGQLVRPLARVGLYVPGGSAAYPSSVLMNALAARAAGVPRVVMVTPPGPGGKLSPGVLVAAAEAGVQEIFRLGGAQAIAALAFGTVTVPRVDKITGPGNIYVTAAKRLVFGQVDIDMLAGPSEVLVVADAGAPAAAVAADLLAQAEHDSRAAVLLVTPSQELARAVAAQVEQQLATLPRREIAAAALANHGAAVVTASLDEAMEIANQLAPEHLELALADPWPWLGRVQNAGAVFLGYPSSEPLGDYYAGPNHVLPTGGTTRFFSPLGVESFLKRTSVIAYSQAGLEAAAPAVTCLARAEGLDGHARAVQVRLKVKGTGLNDT